MSRRERNYHLVGWILFLVCAGFFIASAALSGDLLYLAGSIVFFVACVAFLIPLLSKERHTAHSGEREGTEGGGQGPQLPLR